MYDPRPSAIRPAGLKNEHKSNCPKNTTNGLLLPTFRLLCFQGIRAISMQKCPKIAGLCLDGVHKSIQKINSSPVSTTIGNARRI